MNPDETPIEQWIDGGSAEDLAPGDWRVVELDDIEIAIFNVAGRFLAIEDVCTHDGAELTGGPVEGDQIICPRHGARFCLRTGAALSPPAYEPVRCFTVRVLQGRLQVAFNPDE